MCQGGRSARVDSGSGQGLRGSQVLNQDERHSERIKKNPARFFNISKIKTKGDTSNFGATSPRNATLARSRSTAPVHNNYSRRNNARRGQDF